MKLQKLALGAFFLLGSIFQLQAQTLDEVITKHLEANGGKDKLLTLNTVVMEGVIAIQGQEIPIKLTQSHNKGQRVEFTAMGMTGFIINTPTEGWTYMPFQGQTAPEALPADAVKETSDVLDIQGHFINYKEKGHEVLLVGKEDVDGTECFKITSKLKNGLEITSFVDAATYYVIKTVSKSKSTGQEVEQTQTFSNFKKTDDGFVFPYNMTGFGPGELLISKIEINKPVAESVFKPTN